MNNIKPALPVSPLGTVRSTFATTVARSGAVEQIQPARSISALARGATGSNTTDFVSMNFGSKVRNALQGNARPVHVHSGRRFMATLRASFGSSGDSAVTSLADELAMLGDDAELNNRIGATDMSPGMRAMLVAMVAERSFSGSARRKRLEEQLDEMLGEEGWQLELMGSMEFGADQVALAQLRSLYQSASQTDKPLAAWFKELRGLPDRRRKLRVLIRALGLNLSSEGQAIQGEQLASVITDLKRLLIFLGVDEQCARLARNLPEPRPSGDDVLTMLLSAIDSGWVLEASLRKELKQLGISRKHTPRFAYYIKRLLQALPPVVYRDHQQLEQIVEALQPIVDEDEEDL